MNSAVRMLNDNVTAETIYMRQHATISAAIERLQATLDNMLDPTDNEITWGDVATNAHVADAASTLLESIS